MEDPTVVSVPDTVTDIASGEPEIAADDVLVEEVSIDGMCGVY